mgnify:FL=1
MIGVEATRFRRVFLALCAVGTAVVISAQPGTSVSWEGGPVFPVSEYQDGWILGDSDGDGAIDRAVFVDDDMQPVRQALDFNKDGLMDDFYFYRNGVLVRQQVDSNYDGAVDLWVYIEDGIYIVRYDQDTDFDGVVDHSRSFR